MEETVYLGDTLTFPVLEENLRLLIVLLEPRVF